MSAFGNGSNSNGQFWFGGSTFPGFLYKKNVGVGGRRSTKMTPGGNITCNSSTYLYNKYKPGSGGVGASSTSNRRAKNRLATVCDGQKCFPCYPTLGQYSNYTGNPNGFIPCPNILPTFKTITYNGNNNTGGTVPVDGSSPYISGTNITVLGNTGNLTKAGDAFIGWNTVAGGTGISYVGGNTFELNVNTILYAQYTIPFLTTGGSTISYTNSTYVITFTTDGTMTFKSGITMPTTINYLFVGGGGGGGINTGSSAFGSGGGAGGQILYTTNVLGSTPTTTLTFTVAGPAGVPGTPANGNPTICSGPGITTITATGGLKGGNSTVSASGNGGVGVNGGGSGGKGGTITINPSPPFQPIPGVQGTPGSLGSSYTINGTVYYFSGGGAGGNNSTGNPAGGLGGGGGSGSGSNGNNAVNPYTGPNGISQGASSAGYTNSGGGGAGSNSLTTNTNRAGGSGIVVVWFSYP